jgi:hypothetical protein
VWTEPDPSAAGTAHARRQDLLQTLVLLLLLLTPAWLTPTWFARPWLWASLLLGLPALYLSWSHAPWVPSPAAELPRILAALDLSPADTFCDLGAGDGRLVARVRAATGATCFGIEASPLLCVVAWLFLWSRRDPGATVRFGDMYRADLSGVDAVYVWGTGYSAGTAAFGEWLRAALPPGARVVSYHQQIPGLTLVRADLDGQRPLYTYRLDGGR